MGIERCDPAITTCLEPDGTEQLASEPVSSEPATAVDTFTPSPASGKPSPPSQLEADAVETIELIEAMKLEGPLRIPVLSERDGDSLSLYFLSVRDFEGSLSGYTHFGRHAKSVLFLAEQVAQHTGPHPYRILIPGPGYDYPSTGSKKAIDSEEKESIFPLELATVLVANGLDNFEIIVVDFNPETVAYYEKLAQKSVHEIALVFPHHEWTHSPIAPNYFPSWFGNTAEVRTGMVTGEETLHETERVYRLRLDRRILDKIKFHWGAPGLPFPVPPEGAYEAIHFYAIMTYLEGFAAEQVLKNLRVVSSGQTLLFADQTTHLEINKQAGAGLPIPFIATETQPVED
ncbi:MAG: hypothetical protein Q7S00_03590, partial [bacterium]|nr:hypothetical protein [bacterium]